MDTILAKHLHNGRQAWDLLREGFKAYVEAEEECYQLWRAHQSRPVYPISLNTPWTGPEAKKKG